MPRNVRNFWLTARIDGKSAPVSCGPQRADGGFDLTIQMRRGGDATEALEILGRAGPDGALVIKVRGHGACTAHEITRGANGFDLTIHGQR